MNGQWYGMIMLVVAVLLRAEVAWSEPVPDEVANVKDAWQKKLLEFRQECESAKSDVLTRYRKTLDTLRQGVQQNGDLEGVQALDAEIERLGKKKELPVVGALGQSIQLARTISQAREAYGKAEWEGARKTQECTDQYLQTLDQRIKQAVRENHLDLARAYDAERKTVRDAPEYQAAKFVLAEKEAECVKLAPTGTTSVAENKSAPPKPALPVALGPDRPGRNGQKLTPRTDPEGLYDAVQVGEGGQPLPPGTAPVTYKPLPVSETGKVPMFDSVGITAEGCMDAAAEVGKYHLRFRLRSKNLSTTYPALKVLVQYFVKNPNGTGIREAQTHFALIPSLGSKGMFCEMKPAELPYSYISRGRTLGSAEHNRVVNAAWAEDREPAFAGVVVSVYAMDDKLLGQVASSTTLKERGKASFQLPVSWMQRVRDHRPGK